MCVFQEFFLSIYTYTVEEVLKEYRDRFIADIDANVVVNKFLYKGIIPEGVQRNISRIDCPKQQNEILHECLLRTCSNEALMTACGIIASVQGNPRMSALGKDMQRRLGSGVLSIQLDVLGTHMCCICCMFSCGHFHKC